MPGDHWAGQDQRWLFPETKLERFDRTMIEPVLTHLDSAIEMVVASRPKKISVGVCCNVLYGSEGPVVSQFARLPEYGRFAHCDMRVLSDRILELVDDGRLAMTDERKLDVASDIRGNDMLVSVASCADCAAPAP
jgi:hypothetical protein